MNDLFSLAGRSALVTGGSRGIGRMIAAGFLRAGARVTISARKAAACDATAAELSALGPCVSLPIDVSTVEGAKALAAAYSAREPHLDILVNNAGAAWGADFDEFPESGWNKVVERRAVQGKVCAPIKVWAVCSIHFAPASLAIGSQPKVWLLKIAEEEELSHFPQRRQPNDVLNVFASNHPRGSPGLVFPSKGEFFVVLAIPGVPASRKAVRRKWRERTHPSSLPYARLPRSRYGRGRDSVARSPVSRS